MASPKHVEVQVKVPLGETTKESPKILSEAPDKEIDVSKAQLTAFNKLIGLGKGQGTKAHTPLDQLVFHGRQQLSQAMASKAPMETVFHFTNRFYYLVEECKTNPSYELDSPRDRLKLLNQEIFLAIRTF